MHCNTVDYVCSVLTCAVCEEVSQFKTVLLSEKMMANFEGVKCPVLHNPSSDRYECTI